LTLTPLSPPTVEDHFEALTGESAVELLVSSEVLAPHDDEQSAHDPPPPNGTTLRRFAAM